MENIKNQLAKESNVVQFKDHANGWGLIETYSNTEVEVIIFTDNKVLSVGAKRNMLNMGAMGQYVCHVDCDDQISTNYISKLLEGIKSGADVITFDVAYHHNGGAPKPVYYDKAYGKDINEPTCYKRIPNHLMCFKKELAIAAGFPDISFGEDAQFAKNILPMIKTQHRITETLYHYYFNSETTETQRK